MRLLKYKESLEILYTGGCPKHVTFPSGKVVKMKNSGIMTVGNVHNFIGGMAEWTKATVLKTVVAARSPRVRIPLPPP